MYLTRNRGAAAALLAFGLAGCGAPQKREPQKDESQKDEAAQRFLDAYTPEYLRLYRQASLADWDSNTHIVEGDDTNKKRTEAANEEMAAFTGSLANIATARELLARRDRMTSLQAKQVERVLFLAADTPQTVPDLVTQRIAAETAQTEKLFGFTFRIDGEEVTVNRIDTILENETDLELRRKAWESSKEVGPALREGLAKLRTLRNATVRALGYRDFFAYQVSEYGMETAEMMELMERFNRELRPLYRELHTFARHLLAEKLGQGVPDLIPAHWLPNRWAQEWGALVKVKGMDLDSALGDKSAEWIVRQAEKFYVSIGFDPLPGSFWERSSMFPLPATTRWKKNNHASAWHIDLDADVRSLMSVDSNAKWYDTAHHELGHVYYFISYTTPDVPPLLRNGANRAWHEAVGSLMGLASMQPRFVKAVGLASAGDRPDPMQALLKEALNLVVFIPFAAGVMTRFEHDLYAEELPVERWNDRWWELAARYQGIAPPSPRDQRFCDPPTKTHINEDAAQYYDYALSFVLLIQLHEHIARQLLHEDPHDTNYFGRREVGDFLRSILRPGNTVDWRKLMQEKTGEDLSARAMLAYFEPLMHWLQEQNRGRKHTLPELR
jgi:peptidyl-dipeptidase A